jgi:putative MATE family efflux protein
VERGDIKTKVLGKRVILLTTFAPLMKDLTKGNVGNSIILFAIPMLIGNLFQQLYNIVDSVIVGKYIGHVALAAVGASFPILFTLMAMVVGVTIGSSILISQYFGAKNLRDVKISSDTIQIFLIISSIILSIVFFIFSRSIFRMLSVPEEVLPEAVQYFDIIILTTTLPSFAVHGISAILRGVGNSSTPIYFIIASFLMNIALDLLFVLQFHWGIAGAAWATGISTILCWLSLWAYINRKKESLVRFTLNYRKWEFNRQNFRLAIKIGLPTGIQQTLVGLGSMALISIVSPFGTPVLAAYTAAGRVDMFVSMPSMNLAAALSTFVAQNLGAKKYDRIKEGLRKSLVYSALLCITLTMVVILFGNEIMWLFTEKDSPYVSEIIKTGKEYLVVVSSFYLIFTTMFIVNGVIRGAGATFVPMLITTLSLWVVRVPTAYILSRHMGETGIWWSIPIGWAIGCTGSIIYYRSGLWKKHRVRAIASTPITAGEQIME